MFFRVCALAVRERATLLLPVTTLRKQTLSTREAGNLSFNLKYSDLSTFQIKANICYVLLREPSILQITALHCINLFNWFLYCPSAC